MLDATERVIDGDGTRHTSELDRSTPLSAAYVINLDADAHGPES